MKADKIPALIGFLVIVLLAFLIIWKAEVIGISKGRLEQDARERQNVAEDWEMAQAVDEDICAMLFYDNERKEYVYAVYLSKEGFSYGYFFTQGGTDAYMAEGVKGIVFEDKGIALLSLNEDKVCKVVTEDSGEEILVDPQEPFAIVLPIDCGAITLYDAQNQVVTLYDTYTGA
nr:hypothetical protein [uncultured Acetatifactor sp.]